MAAISKNLNMGRRTASKLLDAIVAKHKSVADIFCTDRGVTLMRIDSDIILNAVKECQAEGLSVLPIHELFDRASAVRR